MFDNIWKIDKSMGEKRSHQVLGIIILVGVVVVSLMYKFKLGF